MNLITGQFGTRAILHGMTMSKDGIQIGRRKFSQANTPFILHSEIGTNAKRNMIIHKDLYFSVFHQLFYLNKADPIISPLFMMASQICGYLKFLSRCLSCKYFYFCFLSRPFANSCSRAIWRHKTEQAQDRDKHGKF